MIILLLIGAMLFSSTLYLWPDSVWRMKGDLEKVRRSAGLAVVIMFAVLIARLW